MRFARRRDARRSENQVTRFASDSLIFFHPARCSVGSPPEAHGRTPRAFEARFLTTFGMTKGGDLRPFAKFAKFVFGYRVPGITINH
ncbi:hypothetical protein [Tannerella forsythia]|uniref:hypothetical protein n=1 Tax=Tannerella forsythia TaxID=28112 RepID=UPI001FCB77AD|nr:hypothetical protein [Tannerella forsythia]